MFYNFEVWSRVWNTLYDFASAPMLNKREPHFVECIDLRGHYKH